MSPIPHLSAAQLHHAAEIQTKIESLQAELARLLDGTASPAAARTQGSAGRAATIAGAKAYWAKRRAAAKPAKAGLPAPAKKSRISAAGRRRIAAASRARWAKVKAAGKTRL